MMELSELDLIIEVGVERKLFGAQALITKIDGWYGGGAAVRRPATQRLNGHGEFSERGWREARLVSVEGQAWADTRAEAAALVDEYAAHLADGTRGMVTVIDPDHGTRRAECYLTGTPELDWDTDEGFSFAFDMVCPDPRKYGLVPVSGETGRPVPGGGLVFPLFSAGPSEQVARSLAINPSMETASGTSVATWSNSVQSQEWARTGASSIKVSISGQSTEIGFGSIEQGTSLLLPGVTYTALIHTYSPEGGSHRVQTRYYGSTKTEDYGPFVSGTAVHEHRIVFTVPVDTLNVAFRVNASGGGTVYADDFLVVEGAYAGAYFDGGTPAGEGFYYEWEGPAHESHSRKYALAAGGGALNFGVPGSDGTVTLTNVGTADTTVKAIAFGPAPEGFTITEVETGRRLVYVGAVPAGQELAIDGKDGSVLLEGYAERSALLTVREWFTLPGRTSRKYLVEAPSGDPRVNLEAVPAWW